MAISTNQLYLRYGLLLVFGLVFVISFGIEYLLFLNNNALLFSIIFLPLAIIGVVYNLFGGYVERLFIPVWLIGILSAVWILINGFQRFPDLVLPSIMFFVLGLFALLTFVLPLIYLWTTQQLEKYSQWNSENQHTGVVVVHYRHAFLDFPMIGVAMLVKGFYQIKNFRRIYGLYEKEPYKVYHYESKEDIVGLINNPQINKIWIFGHGLKHGIQTDEGALYYCEVAHSPPKEFIAQMHCNPFGGKSLADYLVSEHDDEHQIVNDGYRNYILNKRDIKRYLEKLNQMRSSSSGEKMNQTSENRTLEQLPVQSDSNDGKLMKFEDWKMAKDRIDSFDKAILNIRLAGIPIVLLIVGVGIAIADIAKSITVPYLNCSGAALAFLLALFILPLFFY